MDNNSKTQFLRKASEQFAPNQHVNKLLKSYYMTNIKHIVENQTNLSNTQIGDKVMCRKCSSRWCDGNFVLTYVPSKVKGSRAQRLIDSLNTGESLPKKQKVRAKWYRKRIKSSVVITCNLCRHKTPLYLEKPDKQEEHYTSEVQTKVKLKKKKKDRTAGLKLKHITPTAKQETSSSSSSAKLAPKVMTANLNTKKVKSNDKVKSKKQSKILSKTQKNNTLLQLATMLKSASKSNTSENDRLKNLLR